METTAKVHLAGNYVILCIAPARFDWWLQVRQYLWACMDVVNARMNADVE